MWGQGPYCSRFVPMALLGHARALPPNRAYPGKTWTLGHAAGAGQLIEVYCTHCRRLTRFLAADLVTLLDPCRDALAPPFACSRCGREDYVSVRLHAPADGDWGVPGGAAAGGRGPGAEVDGEAGGVRTVPGHLRPWLAGSAKFH